MPNTHHPASVASRLTDEDILELANYEGYSGVAAVLRDYVRLRNENAQLKARLEAVVKECEKFDHLLDNLTQTANDLGCELSAKSAKSDKIIITAILRAARGEGNVE